MENQIFFFSSCAWGGFWLMWQELFSRFFPQLLFSLFWEKTRRFILRPVLWIFALCVNRLAKIKKSPVSISAQRSVTEWRAVWTHALSRVESYQLSLPYRSGAASGVSWGSDTSSCSLRPSVPPSLRPVSTFHGVGNSAHGQICQPKFKNIRKELPGRNSGKQPWMGAGWTSRWARSLLRCWFSKKTSRQISGSVQAGWKRLNRSENQAASSNEKSWRKTWQISDSCPPPASTDRKSPPRTSWLHSDVLKQKRRKPQGENWRFVRARIGSSVQTQLAEDRPTLRSVWRL